jgi:hypothetical protein
MPSSPELLAGGKQLRTLAGVRVAEQERRPFSVQELLERGPARATSDSRLMFNIAV